MPDFIAREKLLEETRHLKWIFPYNELLAVFDQKHKIVELIEDYAPPNGLFAEAWRTTHFPSTSPLVVSARREGTKSIFRLKLGTSELKLLPTFAPIGIESVSAEGGNIKITYAGLGGGGVSASYCRGIAKGVLGIEGIQRGGGNKYGRGTIVMPALEKTIVCVDDTDSEYEGATYALVHNIAMELNSDSCRYFTHVNAQLFPENPHKTKNCMSTAVSFVCKPGTHSKIVECFRKRLAEETLSKNTAFVAMCGVMLPEAVRQYSLAAKRTFLTSIEEVKHICKSNGIDAVVVTGEKGLIGSLAGLGMHDNPEFAASLPNFYEL